MPGIKDMAIAAIPYNQILPDGTAAASIVMEDIREILKSDDHWEIEKLIHNDEEQKLIILMVCRHPF